MDCPCHVVIRCLPKFKALLMENKKNLAGAVDPKGFKYFMAQYLPDAFKAAQAKHRERINQEYTKNLTRTPQQRVVVWVVGPDLIVDNKVITGLIHPPSPGDICRADKNYHKELDSVELLFTKPFSEKGSTFQGFAICTSKILPVFLAYCKVQLSVPNTKHIMCAYKVAGEQDSCDDGEYHGGLHMLQLLKASGKENIALFMSRQAGPDKLGQKHFKIIRDLTSELLQILDLCTDKHPVDLRWVPTPASGS